MRRQPHALACGFVFCFILGCSPKQGVPPPVTGISPDETDREMGTLAFLAYVGDDLTGTPESVDRTLNGCMQQALAAQASKWTLAWGPVAYHFPVSKLDDNMMYVVRETANPTTLAIVVRGTNPKAIDDWLAEDFDVDDMVSWPVGAGQPKISKGTSEGLHILQELTPAADPQSTLAAFLTQETAASPSGLRLHVTGHSLGGALSPALALWLHDTQSTWDPQGKTVISVYPLAGPTPGNADFAAYYDSVLGKTTHRLWNPFDLPPHTWNHEAMGKIAGLYEPLTRPSDADRAVNDGLRSLVKDKNYTQIVSNQESLSGSVQPGDGKTFLDEVAWQHHCGYLCALGISVDSSILPNCPDPTSVPCNCNGG